MTVLADDFAQIVTDSQAASGYLAWARDNHGGKGYSIDNPKTGSELQKWMVFRDQLLRGTRPVPPTMTTAMGKWLVDGGVLYLDATAPTPPPPPPTPAATWIGSFDNGLSTTLYPHQSFVGDHAQVVADPLGSGHKVLRLAVDDTDRPYTGATNPRADFESPPLFYPGNEAYILVQPLIPKETPLVPDVGGNWFQWCETYGPPYGGSPPFGPDIRERNGVNCFSAGRGQRYNYDRIWWGPPVDGLWHAVILHMRFATDATGFVEVFFDGVLQTLTNGQTRVNMVTLDPGVNWDGTHGNFLNINQYRKAGMIAGIVTTYHAAPAVGPTYESVAGLALA